MKFNYQARAKTGEIKSGEVEASSKESAVEVLRTRGLYVTALEVAHPPIYARRVKIFERVSKRELVIFSRQLAIMFKSKVPLVETFRTLAKQTRNTVFKEQIAKLAEDIEGGNNLSRALALYPKLFSPFYVNMVKAGEASGKLTDVFLYLADYLEKDHNFKSKIRGAMIYPAFVLFVFMAVTSLIITFVIPQLGAVLTQSGQKLPWITELVLGLSGVLRKNIAFIIIALILVIIGIIEFFRTPMGKRLYDEYSLRIPVFGNFFKKIFLARFSLNLSTLIAGGLPIAQALQITGNVVGNDVYEKIISETENGVKRGESMSSIMQKYPAFVTPLFHQMIVVGEKTGTLDSSLMNVVEFYQKDVDRNLDDFIKLLEPLLIVSLGLVVGGLMAAVLIPLYSIGIV